MRHPVPSHRELQERAIELARASKQEKEPYLFVGAVIVDGAGAVVAEACRGQVAAGDHAEYTAIQKIMLPRGLSAVGGTAYTTLEPCTFRGPGKTPCFQHLVDAQIRRVFVGSIDPNVSIRGSGIKELQLAGIEVQLFDSDLTSTIHQLNHPFETHHRRPPGPLDRIVESRGAPADPLEAAFEHLRTENLYMPRREVASIFETGRALVQTDGARVDQRFDVVEITAATVGIVDDYCRRFAAESPRIKREGQLGRHYLTLVVNDPSSCRGEEIARGLAQRLGRLDSGFQPKLDIMLLIGWIACRRFVDLSINRA